jgi:hypothetical protein
MALYYVNTDSTAGGDGTTNATSGANRAYATLAAAVSARWTGTPGSIIEIECSAPSGVADTAAVTIADVTSTSTNRLRIYAATGHEARANSWDTSRYRLSGSAGFAAMLSISDEFVRIEGLQIENSRALADQPRCVSINATASSDVRITGCRLWNSGNTTSPSGADVLDLGNNVAFKVTIANTIFVGGERGFRSYFADDSGAVLILYNNLAIGQTATCFRIGGATAGLGNTYLKNNIAQGAGITNYEFVEGTGSITSATNISEDATSPQTGLRSLAVTFENEGSGDYRIASGDTAAKDAGTDLSGDAQYAFSTDINGTTRSGTWDIGPHEYVAAGGGSVVPILQIIYRQQRA